jgi:hypothetical protein
MKIVNVPTVLGSDIENELNISLFDCEFTQYVENDTYALLDLTEDNVNTLKEDIEWYEGKGETGILTRMRNELKIVEYFRSLGYTVSILVYVSW